MTLVNPQVIQQGNNYYVQHGDDRGLYVEFSMQAVENKQKSLEAGRPIFEDKEFITIRIAGDSKTVRIRPVNHEWDGTTPPDSERWPKQYAAFKNQQSQTPEGTPVTEWPMITKADAASLKAINIHTVEMLANISDGNLGFGMRGMRDKAKAWIDNAKDNAGLARLQAENEQLKKDLEAMKNQINALGETKKKRAKSEVNDGEDTAATNSSGL